MSRNFPNWLQAYTDYTNYLEAPTSFHYFSGISAISGALHRKVWFDQGFFKWYPNFYIIFVARPGIASKSTSIDAAISILRDVPGIHIGPSSLTWQALVQHMGNVTEQVDIDGDLHTMSSLSFAASELGVFLDFRNREMVDVLVDLWDGKTGSWEKLTKMSGMETVVNPWIAFIAGTTPSWLGANVSESIMSGGLSSRCIFVYGERKRHLTAYLKKSVSKDFVDTRQKLLTDLETISLIKGEYTLTREAELWGEQWYEQLWNNTPAHLHGHRFEGYVSRKQTHLHKLAITLSAAQKDERIITIDNLQEADTLLTGVEADMIEALRAVGRIPASQLLENLVAWIKQKGTVNYAECYRFLTPYATHQDCESILRMASDAGFVKIVQVGNVVNLSAI